jgi:uncharacterized protein (TIGR03437 family)
LKKLSFLLCLLLFLSIPELVNAQVLSFSPEPFNLVAQAGAQTVQGTLTVTGHSADGGSIGFSLAQESSWLQVSTPTTWQTPATITVTANLSLLPAGTTSAQGSIVFFNPNAGSLFTYQSVPVNLSVTTLTVSPLSVGFLPYLAGSSTFPPSQTLSVTGGAFSIGKASADNWYTAAISGSPANAVVVSVDQAALPSLTAGAYSGTLTITPTGVSNPVPVNVPVSLTVAAAPVVSVSPSAALSFQWQVNGTDNPSQQSIQLSSSDINPDDSLTFTATASAPWIQVLPINPGGYVFISVDGAGLVAQSAPYTATVTVTLTGAVFTNGQSSLSIPISLDVSNFPLINVSPTALSFSYQFGSGSAVQAATIAPTSSASPATELQYTAGTSSCTGGSWLAVPSGLQTTGTAFSVSVNPTVLATLPPQTYTCNLTVTPAATGSGTAQQAAISIPVTLNVTNTPSLLVSSNALVFAYQTGLTPAAAAPAAQTVAITSNSGAPLEYLVSVPSSASAPWLQVTGNLTGTTDQTSIAVGVIPGLAAAGTSDATISIAAFDPTGHPVGTEDIDVKLDVSSSPLLTVTPPGPITLTGTLSQSQPQQIALASTDPNSPLTTAVQFSDSGNWLSYNQPPVATPGSFTIFGTPATGMTPGSYAGTITISATGAGNNAVADSPYVVPVTFQYNQAAVSVSPTSLSFTQPFGGQADTARQVSVATSGAVLPFTAVANDAAIGWLSVTSGTGSTPGSFSVSTDASRLTSGTYYGAVYVTAPNAGQVRIPVTFTVTPGTISASTTPLNFTQIAGGPAAVAQTVAVQGTAGLNFTVSAAVNSPGNGTWLTATVGSGTATSGIIPASVQVSVNAASLSSATYPATYTGTVTIASPGATGSPIAIPVNLTLVAPDTLTASPTSLSYSYVIGSTAPAGQTVQLGSNDIIQYAVTVKTTDGGNWLAVSPTQGQIGCLGIPPSCLTGGMLSVTVNPAGLIAGNYTGTITAASPSTMTTATVNVSLAVSVPTPVITGIQNAASYTTGALAPGENIVIYGTGIGPGQTAGLQLTTTGTVATTVSNTQVFFDSNPAPVIYASANQTSVMVPEEVAGRTTTQITVVYQGLSSAPLSYNVAPANPGIYTENMMGTGPGSILNQDYSVNGPNQPAAKGSYIQVYLTGTGDTTPALATGAVNPANGSGLKTSVTKYTATVGGIDAPVVYQGTAPGFVEGVMQFNIQIPVDAPSGAQPIVIQAGSSTTVVTFTTQPGVTVQVQ